MLITKMSVVLTGLLVLALIVLAVISYLQFSQLQQMRDDMAAQQQVATAQGQELRQELASLQQTVNTQGQEFGRELASLRTEVEQLAAEDDLAARLEQMLNSQEAMTLLTPSWTEQQPNSVKTIRRSDYGADWPFHTSEAQVGCHGNEIIVIVGGGEFMVDASSDSLHSFLPDIQDVSILDPSSAQMDRARERLTEEGRNLCRGTR